MINLANVINLDFESNCPIETSFELLEILKQAPQISSLSISPEVLIPFLLDNIFLKHLYKKNFGKHFQILKN